MKIVVATHGGLASGFKNTLEMMIGELEEIKFVSLTDEGQISFELELKNLIESYENDEILFLTDIMGGSPFITCTKIKGEMNLKAEIISGLNFGMLLEAYFSRNNLGFDELVDKVVNSAIEGIVVGSTKPCSIKEGDE